MNCKLNMLTIGEVIASINNGELIRESYQRTPSCDIKMSIGLINAILESEHINVLTFATIKENDTVKAILDGSSRLDAICKYTNNEFSISANVLGVDGTNTKTALFFKDLSDNEKQKFLDYSLAIADMGTIDLSQRTKCFLSLNRTTPLSAIQKNKGNTSENFNDVLKAFTDSPICSKILSARLIQKDEPVTIVANILACIDGKYTANNAKMVKEVQTVEVNLDDLKLIFDILQHSIIGNKYQLVAMVTAMYNALVNMEENTHTSPDYSNCKPVGTKKGDAERLQADNLATTISTNAKLLNELLNVKMSLDIQYQSALTAYNEAPTSQRAEHKQELDNFKPFKFDGNLNDFIVETSGANSVPKNEKRLKDATDCLNRSIVSTASSYNIKLLDDCTTQVLELLGV